MVFWSHPPPPPPWDPPNPNPWDPSYPLPSSTPSPPPFPPLSHPVLRIWRILILMPGWCVPKRKFLDDTSLERCVPYTMRPLNDGSLGRLVNYLCVLSLDFIQALNNHNRLADPWVTPGVFRAMLRSPNPIHGQLQAVLGIRIRICRIRMFLGLPDLDPLVWGLDPDPDPSLQHKCVERTEKMFDKEF